MCAALGYTPPVHACPGAECTAPVRLPAFTSMPGNLVYFQVLAEDPGPLTLRTAAGDAIAAGIRTLGSDRVFAPEAPLSEDTQVVLEYRESCVDGPSSVTSTFSLVTTQPGVIELRPAELMLEERGIRYVGDRPVAAFVRLLHLGPDATGKGLPLLHSLAMVDPGTFEEDVQLLKGPQIEIVAPCQSLSDLQLDSCSPPFVVMPGVHAVEVRSHFVGQDVQPAPVRLEVELRCPASDPALGADRSDAGTPDVAPVDPSPGGDARADAGSGSANADPLQERAGALSREDAAQRAGAPGGADSGCTLQRASTASLSRLLLGVSLALAALGTRRRRFR